MILGLSLISLNVCTMVDQVVRTRPIMIEECEVSNTIGYPPVLVPEVYLIRPWTGARAPEDQVADRCSSSDSMSIVDKRVREPNGGCYLGLAYNRG